MAKKPAKHFAVITIPLNREEIVHFLLPPKASPKGAKIQIIGQRPSAKAEARWIEALQTAETPTITDYLAIDNPRHNLVKTRTDRLVPVEILQQPGFLTRSLGGWNPIYFGVARLPASFPPKLAAKFPAQLAHDPLLKHLEVVRDYGTEIPFYGADPAQVARLAEEEAGCDWPAFIAALLALHRLRPQAEKKSIPTAVRTAYIERLYSQTLSGKNLAAAGRPPIPKILLYDELLSQMRLLELDRRAYLAAQNEKKAAEIQQWQEKWQAQTGTVMIVKGEYIAGRHRGSLVLIAPELGVVVKQPAPEPFHEIELDAKTVNGRSENWPFLTQSGAVVTPRGRVRLHLEEGSVPRLHQIFQHSITFSTLTGCTLQSFVTGQTVQEYVLQDHARMTAGLYDCFILHQQTCEALGAENGDWHALNFVRRAGDGEIVHVDWGAARPLRPREKSKKGNLSRLNQVANIAYSFHNEALAHRVQQLHLELLADPERLETIKRQAQTLAAASTPPL